MRLRYLLLTGAALPLALGAPAFAAERTLPAPLVLAQDDQSCEGQDCPQQDNRHRRREHGQGGDQQQDQQQQDQGGGGNRRHGNQQQEEQQQQEGQQQDQGGNRNRRHDNRQQEQQQEQQQPVQEPQTETQPSTDQAPQSEDNNNRRRRHNNQQQQQEQQGGGQQQQQQEEQQPSTEQPAPQTEQTGPQSGEGTGHRNRRHDNQQGGQQDQQGGQQGQQGGQQDHQQQQQGEAQPPAGGEQPTVVEQQLEAQGDADQARRVRSLRDRLQRQLEQATGGEQQNDQGGNDQSRRDRNRSDGDHNRDRSWWHGDEDEGQVVEERGGRIIIDLGGGNIYVEPVVPDEGDRLLYGADDVEVQNLPHGRTRTIVHRPHGVDIVTIRDRRGNIVKRSRFLPNGDEIVLIDNRYPDDDSALPPPILYDVPPPRVHIPRDRYVVDLGEASDEDIRDTLLAPPVDTPPRRYTLDEVLRNESVREYSPRIDLDTITFEFGSSTIGDDQMGSLEELGRAMQDVIARHPDEVYLIEGHTDAVGSDYDNLILSDQRAEAVATALSQNFDIPPENLVTEGYGEQFLKVNTEGPERQNRRATIVRVTELLQAQNQ